MLIYVVQSGDTLFSIARKYRVSVDEIVKDNALSDASTIEVGQSLILHPSTMLHEVVTGDTLSKIGRMYGLSIDHLVKSNPQISNPSLLYPGNFVQIIYENYNKVVMEVNGYAYSNTKEEVLRNTLPHLTYLSIFAYRFLPSGELVMTNDTWMLPIAKEYQVAPMLTFTNMNSTGKFDSSLAHELLTNQGMQDQLLQSLLMVMQEKGYYGINIDFEYVYPEDKSAYNEFIARANLLYSLNGLVVFTALAPKDRDKPGLLYQAHDYRFHGRVADRVILMTYEYGYTYGPAMAVAPLNQIEKVIRYGIGEIPSRKILMGIPNYGYDFQVPFVQGVAARSQSHLAAIQQALNLKVPIQYDEVAATPFFEYTVDSQAHRVYFEDARSIERKIKLAIAYQLAGVSYWTIREFFPQNWQVLEHLVTVKKVI